MVPTDPTLDALVGLLAADPGTLANAAALHVHLVSAPFTPGPGLTMASITVATFPGSAPKSAGIGVQQDFTNPVSGLRTIQILEPAGGWTWICTANPASPESIYGYVLTDNADSVIYASERFNAATIISGAGQGISLSFMRFALSSSAMA